MNTVKTLAVTFAGGAFHPRKPKDGREAFAALDAFLGGKVDRPSYYKSTVRIERRGFYPGAVPRIAVRLHSTDVVSFHPDGTIEVDHGGWFTLTTNECINAFLPAGWQVSGLRYTSLARGWSSPGSRVYEVTGRVVIGPRGGVHGAAQVFADWRAWERETSRRKREDRRARKLQEQVNAVGWAIQRAGMLSLDTILRVDIDRQRHEYERAADPANVMRKLAKRIETEDAALQSALYRLDHGDIVNDYATGSPFDRMLQATAGRDARKYRQQMQEAARAAARLAGLPRATKEAPLLAWKRLVLLPEICGGMDCERIVSAHDSSGWRIGVWRDEEHKLRAECVGLNASRKVEDAHAFVPRGQVLARVEVAGRYFDGSRKVTADSMRLVEVWYLSPDEIAAGTVPDRDPDAVADGTRAETFTA
jgi:hypothetical protein